MAHLHEFYQTEVQSKTTRKNTTERREKESDCVVISNGNSYFSMSNHQILILSGPAFSVVSQAQMSKIKVNINRAESL